jgi:ATP-dependent Lon protease
MKKKHPLLPLRGVVAYPLIGLTIDVGRPVSLKVLLASKEHEIDLVVVTQRDPEAEPSVDGLHQVGTLVQIAKISELGNDTVRVRVIGKQRVRIENVEETDEGYQAVIEPIEKMDIKGAKQEGLVRLIKEQFGELVSQIKGIGTDERRRFETYERLDSLTDYITSKLPIDISKKQEFLEQQEPVERGLMLLHVMKHEYEVVELEREMRERRKKTIEQSLREYYLREQLKTIQQELGGESASV